MSSVQTNVIDDRLYVLRTRWERYVEEGLFELFIEFTVAVNSLAEHFSRMRLHGLVRICEGLEFLGVKLDPEKNNTRGKEAIISADDSKVTVWVIPTTEELMIAQDSAQIARGA